MNTVASFTHNDASSLSFFSIRLQDTGTVTYTESQLLLRRLKFKDYLSSEDPDQSGKHRKTLSQKTIIEKGYSKYTDKSILTFYARGVLECF